MKKLLILIFLLLYSLANVAQVWETKTTTQYNTFFKEAYLEYPSIPKGILEAISYTNTHIRNIQPQSETQSCVGLPSYVGVMGLVEHGKGYFKNSLHIVSNLSGYSVSEIKASVRIQILGYAKAYNVLLNQYQLKHKSIQDQYVVLDALSEIPNTEGKGNNFAFDSQLYAIFKTMNAIDFQSKHQFKSPNINLESFFGKQNFQFLSASKIVLSKQGVFSEKGNPYQSKLKRLPPPCSDISSGFPYAILTAAADTSNYNSRSGTSITHITIHTMQGSYAGAISWFQNPSANVSAHYNIRASDGQITQSVCEIDRAWHVSNSNSYAVGIEHEGYIDDPSWYTNIMYVVSAELAKDIALRNNIPKIRTYDIIGDNGINPISDGCYKIKGHQHFPNQTHTDPGQYWDWNYYYDLINDVPSTPANTYTNCAGTFYDSGGASADYANDERIFYRIEPTGASSVSLNFSSLNLELNYDYLYIYDGTSHNDPLLTVLNGTTIPPTITANSGKMLLEFRTDCGTVASGWEANWTCNTNAPICEQPNTLFESDVNHNEALLNWNEVISATSYEVRIKQSLETTWNTYTTTENSFHVSGLAAQAVYVWQVKSLCSGGNESSWIANEFTQATIENSISSFCSGTFNDTGGVLGSYRNFEDYTYTIQSEGAASIGLNFSSFDVELNYDYVYVYDGPTDSFPLLGQFSGTTLPPNLTSTCNAMTIKFYSDVSTIESGWEATWNCIGTAPEILVKGNLIEIEDGDSTPNITDNTDYGIVDLSASETKTFTIDNGIGTNDLTISSITISGTNAGSFMLSGITLPVVVPAGMSIPFSMIFNPISNGVKTADVEISNDDCDESLYNFSIQGEGGTVLSTQNDVTLFNALDLFPNPNNGTFSIRYNGTIALQRIVITDISGKTIQHIAVGENIDNVIVDLKSIAAGLYFVKVFTSQSAVIKKVLVQ